MPDIGNSGLTGGSQNGPSTDDTYYGRLFQMPEDGYITSVYAMLQSAGATADMQIALFSASGGLTINGKLYEEIKANEVTTTEKWCFIDLASPYFMASGTYFFAVFRAQTNYLIRYITGGLATELAQRWASAYPTFEDPDTNTGSYYSGSEIAFAYVQYTPAVNPAYGKSSLTNVKSITGIKSITF